MSITQSACVQVDPAVGTVNDSGFTFPAAKPCAAAAASPAVMKPPLFPGPQKPGQAAADAAHHALTPPEVCHITLACLILAASSLFHPICTAYIQRVIAICVRAPPGMTTLLPLLGQATALLGRTTHDGRNHSKFFVSKVRTMTTQVVCPHRRATRGWRGSSRRRAAVWASPPRPPPCSGTMRDRVRHVAQLLDQHSLLACFQQQGTFVPLPGNNLALCRVLLVAL